MYVVWRDDAEPPVTKARRRTEIVTGWPKKAEQGPIRAVSDR